VTDHALSIEEQRLLETLRSAAAGVIEGGAARLEIVRTQTPHASFAQFVLTPARPDACRFVASAVNGWIDFACGPENAEAGFELWRETYEQQLAVLNDYVQAIIAGACEMGLRSNRQFVPFGARVWTITFTFVLPDGEVTFTRTPVSLERYLGLFKELPQPPPKLAAIRARHRFRPYMAGGASLS
jgi:hypothetical protein